MIVQAKLIIRHQVTLWCFDHSIFFFLKNDFIFLTSKHPLLVSRALFQALYETKEHTRSVGGHTSVDVAANKRAAFEFFFFFFFFFNFTSRRPFAVGGCESERLGVYTITVLECAKSLLLHSFLPTAVDNDRGCLTFGACWLASSSPFSFVPLNPSSYLRATTAPPLAVAPPEPASGSGACDQLLSVKHRCFENEEVSLFPCLQ